MTDDAAAKLAGVEPPPTPVKTIYSGDPKAGVDPAIGAMLVSHNPDPVPVEPPEVIVLPPANVDAPYVGQTADKLNCTMGNWSNMDAEPHSYAYQWRRDGIDLFNAVSADFYVTVDDAGHSYDCVLTATNSAGSAAVDSNAVVVIAP